MQRKLKARGHADADVAGLLDDLAAQRLQSDTRYAEAYVRSRAERGYGPQRIALELKQRGAAAEIIQQALNGAERDWFEVAVQVDRKKFGGVGRADPEAANRRRRFLEYRGFTAEQVKAVLRRSGPDDTEFDTGG